MKTRLLALGLGLSLFALLFSCSKENKPTEKIEINTKGLPFNSIKEINTQLLQTKFGEKKTTIPRSVLPNAEISDIEVEPIIRPIVSPLIETGKQIHADMIQQLAGTYEWQVLTEEEKNVILNFDDKQMSELALLFTQQPNIAIDGVSTLPRRAASDDRILSCASAALGIEEAYAIFENTRALMTAKGAVRILKLVGRRYLGWVGVALAVVSFVDCVS